jgi:hypothetical protein
MEYPSICKAIMNGQVLTDKSSVSIHEYEKNAQVKLMDRTGHRPVVARYGLSVEYVVPPKSRRIDWDGVKDGTFIVEDEVGNRTKFTGVYVIKVGERKYDGESDVKQNIELGAEDKLEE